MQKRVVIYTRVSTTDQADRGHSLSYQELALEQYCKIHKYIIVKHYQDDCSAKDFDRPQWKSLMVYLVANKREIDSVLILRWDRFSRNQHEAIIVINNLLKMGIAVESIEQPLDMSIPDNKLLLNIYLTIPEIENDKNSIRTTESSRKARIEGCWTGTPPKGYTNGRNGNNKSTLIRNDIAELVIEAFQEVAKNQYPVDLIRKQMNKKGLNVCKQAFLNMLRNVAYTGKIFVKEWKKEDSVVADGLHEAIISDELFNDVQNVLLGKKKLKIKSSIENPALPLRGFLKCPVCEGTLTGGASKGRSKYYNYYKCQNNCIGNIKSEEANALFVRYLSNIKIPQSVSQLYMKIMEDIFHTKEGDIKEKKTQITQKVADVEKGISKVIDEYFIAQRIDEGNYKMAITQFNAKKADLSADLVELEQSHDNFLEYVNFGFPLLCNLDHYFNVAPFKTKQFIIGSIFPEKLYFEDNKYRTTKVNEVLALLTSPVEGLENSDKRQVPKNRDLSSLAPPAGLEPATL